MNNFCVIKSNVVFTFKSNLTGDQQFSIVFQSDLTSEEIQHITLERMRTVPMNKFNILPPFSLSDGFKLDVKSIDLDEDRVELEWTDNPRPCKRKKFSGSDRKTSNKSSA